jgi:hypothetical protein
MDTSTISPSTTNQNLRTIVRLKFYCFSIVHTDKEISFLSQQLKSICLVAHRKRHDELIL